MFQFFAEIDIQIKVALIGAAGVIIAAIIAGIFSLIKKESQAGAKNPDSVDDVIVIIPKSETTAEKQYNSEEYVHNSFIPSLDELEKEDSNDAFAEGLAKFLGGDRSEKDISITRKD